MSIKHAHQQTPVAMSDIDTFIQLATAVIRPLRPMHLFTGHDGEHILRLLEHRA
jgi:hypothetical protein